VTKKLDGKTASLPAGTERDWVGYRKALVEEGAYVFITGRRQKHLDVAVKASAANVSGVQGDIARLADLDRLYETVAQMRGRIDTGVRQRHISDSLLI